MDLANEPNGQREVAQAVKPVVHRLHVVYDLVHVAGPVRRKDVSLGSKQILQRALGAFDLTGKDRLLSHIHEDK